MKGKIIMSRLSFIFLAAALLLTAGCKRSETSSESKTETEAETKAAAKSETKKLSNGAVLPLTTAQFKASVMDYEANPSEWKYLGDKPAVIDFYATWCGPCRSMSPIIEEAAKRYAGDVVFYKVDIDEETELAQLFGIQSIPFFLFIPVQGTPSAQTGAIDAKGFDNMVREILKP